MDIDTEYAYPVCVWEGGAAENAERQGSGGVRLRIPAEGSTGDVGELVRVRAGALAAVESADRGHLGLVEFEVEDREVLLDPAAVHRLREDDVTALDVPAQRDLGRAAAQLPGDRTDHRVVGHLPARDR